MRRRTVAMAVLAAAVLAGSAAGAQAAPAVRTFVATADTSPGAAPAAGRSSTLTVAPGPRGRALLRFEVRGLADPVVQATLRLRATAASRAGVIVRPVTSGRWNESGRAAAAVLGRARAASGALTAGRWVDVDVTSLVRRGGRVTLALTAAAGRAVVASRESGAAPRLVIRTGPGSQAPREAGGVVASYGFEEGSGATARDGSGHANDGTLDGGPAWVAGRVGGGLAFDGVDDLVSVPDAPSLDLESGMTLTAWVKPSALDGWSTVVLKEDGKGLVYALYAGNSAGQLQAETATGPATAARPGVALPVGVWSHVAATQDGSALRVYVDGREVADVPAAGAIRSSAGALRIGGNGVWGERFAGVIDEVRVYDRALSPSQIGADMGGAAPSTAPPPAPAPVAPPAAPASDPPPASPPAASAPEGFGFTDNIQRHAEDDREWHVAQFQSLGARWLRFDFDWSDIQPAAGGGYQWGATDAAVRAATARGLHVLGTIQQSPGWAGARDGAEFPARFAAFAEAVARRYGPMGVHHWEIWNEPNYEVFWGGPPDPEAYTRMLRAAYVRIKQADAGSVVLAGATFPGDFGIPNRLLAAPEFLQRMYAAGAAGHFDALSHHPYTAADNPTRDTYDARGWQWMFSAGYGSKVSLRGLMVANGDGGKKIWATEVGVATNGERSTTEEGQAQYLRDAFRLWSGYPWAGPLFWYDLRDSSTYESFGLLRADGVQKPSYLAFRSAVRVFG